jgi:hypothetical protein
MRIAFLTTLLLFGAMATCGQGTLATRITAPPGAQRVPVAAGSFAEHLRHLPLKPDGAPVLLYDGSAKTRQDVHRAVLAVPLGSKDLQQCADAVIRLRAEYLLAQGQHERIAFHFTNGFLAEWERWRNGERIRVTGGQVRWVAGGAKDVRGSTFESYLNTVFTYAGTRSLQQELSPAAELPIEPGDVFIQGGSPGHAVLVMDVARSSTGRTYFLLAQSYMPAQDMHVLRGPVAGAWYELGSGTELRTPEWTFAWSDRRRW